MEQAIAKPDNAVLRGIFPVLATPFDRDDRIDRHAMARIVDFVLAAGVHGLVFPGVASEFNYLSVDERRQLLAQISEQVDGRVPIVVGASAAQTDDAVELARTGMQYRASGAMIMAPASLGAETGAIIDFFRSIAQQTEIDIILQNAPPPLGAGLPVAVLRDVVSAVPAIRYIKEETLPSGPRISQLLAGAPANLLGVMGGGGARYIIDELNRGACGAMPACEISDIHAALYDAFQAGDLQKARALYNRTLPLLLYQINFRMRMSKEVLKRRGIIAHAGLRAPMPEPDRQDQRELDTLLAEVSDLLIETAS